METKKLLIFCLIMYLMSIMLINGAIRAFLREDVNFSGEVVYQELITGTYPGSENHQKQLVNYLNKNPSSQKAFFERGLKLDSSGIFFEKGVKFDSSGVDIVDYKTKSNGKFRELATFKLKNSDKEFTIDLENQELTLDNREFKADTDKILIKILDDKISIKGEVIELKGPSSKERTHSSFIGEISIYPDGHRDIEKGTTYFKHSAAGPAEALSMELSLIDKDESGLGKVIGIQEKIQYSEDPNWQPTDKETASIKFIESTELGKSDILELKNFDSKIEITLFKPKLTEIRAVDALKMSDETSNGKIIIGLPDGGKMIINDRGTSFKKSAFGFHGNFPAFENGILGTLVINLDGSCEICTDCTPAGHLHNLRETEYIDRFNNKFSIKKDQKLAK